MPLVLLSRAFNTASSSFYEVNISLQTVDTLQLPVSCLNGFPSLIQVSFGRGLPLPETQVSLTLSPEKTLVDVGSLKSWGEVGGSGTRKRINSIFSSSTKRFFPFFFVPPGHNY